MPKFYFSIVDHVALEDTDGTDLPDVEAARQHAYAVARELMQYRKEMLGHRWAEWTMSVRDSNGQQVFSFPMSDAQEASRRERHRPDKPAPQSRG